MIGKPKFWYGWPMVIVLWVVVFLNVGFPQYGANIANAAMIQTVDFDRTVYGYAFTLYTLFNGLLGPLVGKLLKRKGAKFSYLIGGLCYFTGAILLAFFMNNVWMFVIAYGVILGNAVLLATSVPMHYTITLWHEKKRSLALGIGATAAAIGSFTASPIMASIATNFGWQACWYTVIGTSLLSMLIVIIFFVNKPADIGQQQDGYANAKDYVAKEKKVSDRVYRTKDVWTAKEALRNPKTWLIFVGMCGYFMLYILVMANSMLYLTDIGFDLTVAALSFSTMAIASLCGRLLCGFLGDLINPRYIWICTSALLICGVLLLMNCNSPAMMYMYSICTGIGFGGSFTMVPAVLANYYGQAPFAEIKATLELPLNIVSCFGPSVAGIIYAAQGSYIPAFWAYICFGAVAIICLFLATPPKKKGNSNSETTLTEA